MNRHSASDPRALDAFITETADTYGHLLPHALHRTPHALDRAWTTTRPSDREKDHAPTDT